MLSCRRSGMSCGGPDLVVPPQPGVEVGAHRRRVGDGGDPADDLAGVRADEVGGGALQRADAELGGDLGGVDTVRPTGEQQQRLVALLVRHREQQAVGDGADLATERVRGELRGVHGVGEYDDPPRSSAGGQLRAEAGDGCVLAALLTHVRNVANDCGFALDGLSEGRCTLKVFEQVFDQRLGGG